MRYFYQFLYISIPAAITFSCFFPYRKKALSALELHSSTLREASLLIFVVMISGIAALKLWPVYYKSPTTGDIKLLLERPSWDTLFHYVPFSMFIDYYKCCVEYGSSDLTDVLTNIFGNFVAFIPIGLFPALLFRNPTWKRSAAIGLSLSLFTEIGQYFIMRNASVDDLFLNTAGTMFGYFLYLFLQHWIPDYTQKFRCKEI